MSKLAGYTAEFIERVVFLEPTSQRFDIASFCAKDDGVDSYPAPRTPQTIVATTGIDHGPVKPFFVTHRPKYVAFSPRLRN